MANSTFFLAQQLERLEAEAVRRIRPSLTARRFFPVVSNDDPTAASLAFKQLDSSGQAGWFASGAQDFNTLSLEGRKVATPVGATGILIDLEDVDVARAMANGVNLQTESFDEAYTAVDRAINAAAYNGVPSLGITGLLTDTAVVPQAAATGDWLNATADDILGDLATASSAMLEANDGALPPTKVGMPIKYRNLLATTRVSSTSEMTILKWLTTQLEWLTDPSQVIAIPELLQATGETTDLCVLLSATPDVCALRIPSEIDFTAPIRRHLGYDVLCHARCAGLFVKKPLGIYVMKGLEA